MIIDLCGEWKLVWDKENKGVANRWFAAVPNKAKNAKIPELWDGKEEETAAFYYKKIPLTAKDKRCTLRFEGVSLYTEVWFNGKAVGDHFGAFSPFEFDVSPFVKIGDNLLCVRVAKESENGDFDMMSGGESIPADQMPVGLPLKRFPLSGWTGGVSMITGERALISALEVENDPDRERVTVKVSFHNHRNFDANLNVFVRNDKREVCEVKKKFKIDKDNGSVNFEIGFKEVHLWSPETTGLYAVEVRLEGENALMTTFGFRKFDCKQGDFFLNDSVIKIQGVVYSRKPCYKDVKKDLTAIKKLGFNAVRTGGSPFDSTTLDICDELGLLVFQELPMHEQHSGKMGLEATKVLIQEVVKESGSHPSVAAFVLGEENGRMILENGAKLLNHVDSFDATHVAISNLNCAYIDNSQNFKHGYDKSFGVTGKILGVTDSGVLPYSSHKLSLKMLSSTPFSLFLSKYGLADEEEFVIPNPFFGDLWLQDNYKQFTDELKKSGKILLTVKGYDNWKIGSAAVGSATQLLTQKIKKFLDKDAAGIWNGVDDFLRNANELAYSGLAQNIQSLQSCHIVSGYFLEEWADFKNNFNGIVDENRESKGSEELIRAITQPTRLLLSALERVVEQGETVSFQLSFLNRKRVSDATVSVIILDDKRKVISKQSKDFSTQTSLVPLGDFSIKAPKKAGNYYLALEVVHSGNKLHSIEEPIAVIEGPELKASLAQTDMLDNAENSAEITKMLKSKKPLLFSSAMSTWADDATLESLAEAVRGGKVLFLSDIDPEDIKLFNACKGFGITIDYHYSSGSNGTSLHYIKGGKSTDKDAPIFAKEFLGKRVFDKMLSAIAPSVSLSPVVYEKKEAEVFIHSVSITDGELQTGADLQILPFGKGKIILSTLNMEGLETYALANSVFVKVVKLGVG
ncbi:hypothetical protein AGMMS49938_07830 [Fibrobacterales bacterium]|nr:hypothetical protein AGMMS49938_07830 [Fibrobacterales bacterium]